MDVRIESLLEGAARASGAVAIIDVLRAFTTAAVAFANGATRITMVASVEEALVLRSARAGRWTDLHGRSWRPPAEEFRLWQLTL